MAHVDVLAHGLEPPARPHGRMHCLVADGGGELAVRDEVRVPPDRAREVRVDLRGEAVVAELGERLGAGAEVLGAHHATGGHDADEGVEEGLAFHDALVEGVGEGLGGVEAQLHAALHLELVGELVEVGLGGRPVPAQDRCLREGLVDFARHADVGEEHELFDERVGVE